MKPDFRHACTAAALTAVALSAACDTVTEPDTADLAEHELAATVKLKCGTLASFTASGFGYASIDSFYTYPTAYATEAEAKAAMATKNCNTDPAAGAGYQLAHLTAIAKDQALEKCATNPLEGFSCDDRCADNSPACNKSIDSFTVPCTLTKSEANAQTHITKRETKYYVTCSGTAKADAGGIAVAGCTKRECNDGAASSSSASSSGGESGAVGSTGSGGGTGGSASSGGGTAGAGAVAAYDGAGATEGATP